MFHLFPAFLGVFVVMTVPLVGSDEPSRQPAISKTEFEYQVLISQLDEGPKCGGVLVAEGLIVTSATCVLEFGGLKEFLEEAVVYGGGTSLLFDLGTVTNAAIHPQYIASPRTFDIAVIQYVPEKNGPELTPVILNGTLSNNMTCIMSSWWAAPNTWPDRLLWLPVPLPTNCSPPDQNFICFSDDDIEFHKGDYGSPIVCGGMLVGLVPRGGGIKAINITSELDWIFETMASLNEPQKPSEPSPNGDTMSFLHKILHKLDSLNIPKQPSKVENISDRLTSWNNQIVVPLSYVMFALVIFFFVLLFFLVLFTVVLVYYSRK